MKDLHLRRLTKTFFRQMHTLINLFIPATDKVENV